VCHFDLDLQLHIISMSRLPELLFKACRRRGSHGQDTGADERSFMRAADEALYDAKRGGGNRVTSVRDANRV
jgi:hypothetical protein